MMPGARMLRLLAAGVSAGLASVCEAQVVTYLWAGRGLTTSYFSAANWQGESVPPAGALVEFGPVGRDFVGIDVVTVSGLTVNSGYDFLSENEIPSFSIGADGIQFTAPATDDLVFGTNVPIVLTDNQTWNVAAGTVEVRESIAGNFILTKEGAGRLDLALADSTGWTGGFVLNGGKVVVGAGLNGITFDESASLGTGLVTIGPPPTLPAGPPTIIAHFGDFSPVHLPHDFALNGVFSSINETRLVIRGSTTLAADTTIRSRGEPLWFEGGIFEDATPRKLTVDTTNLVALFSSSGWSGGTDVVRGLLIFAGDDNTPGTLGALKVIQPGYAGIIGGINVGLFLSEIDAAGSTGTIGFDSDPAGIQGISIFSVPVDLTGFNPLLRLGSATKAVLDSAAIITPQGLDYRFGGGGGILTVSSQLDDRVTPTPAARNIVADSPSDRPLTVWLNASSTTLTGNVTALHSAIVFETGNLIPAGTGTFTMNSGGYIGTVDLEFGVPAFLDRFEAAPDGDFLFNGPVTTPGIIGFDVVPGSAIGATVSLTGVPLSQFTTTGLNGTYLGTSTYAEDSISGNVIGPGLRFIGTISPNADGVHRFAGFKGGYLNVQGTLTGNSLVIGHPDSVGAFGDPNRNLLSTVLLAGDNTGALAGGTTFYGGHLILDQGGGVAGTNPTTVLGSGVLTFAPVSFALDDGEESGPSSPVPLLSAAAPNLIVGNDIVLNTNVDLGGGNFFTLNGTISGPGGIAIGEGNDPGFQITLGSANTFSGGVELLNGAVVKAEDNTALGIGPLVFGSLGGRAEFTTISPVINGLASDPSTTGQIELTFATNPRLTINQTFDGTYSGDLRADSGGPGSDGVFVKTGPGTLRLENTAIYSYGQGAALEVLSVEDGTLVLSNVLLESIDTTVTVDGGTLAVVDDSLLDNSLTLIAGTLAGNGSFKSAAIGTGLTLAPGLGPFDEIGDLSFGTSLTLNGGGTLEWNALDGFTGDDVQTDLVTVWGAGGLTVEATSADPFTLRIISLNVMGNPGALASLDPDHGTYGWLLFSSVNPIDFNGAAAGTGTFDPLAFTLDLSGFSHTVPLGGSFELVASSNTIQLNFTPVPEPSTYALFAAGLGCVALRYLRRQRRNRTATC